MDLAHRQGNPLLGLFPGEDAHFGFRREHRALHGDGVWVRGDLVRQAVRYLITAVVSVGVASVAGWIALGFLNVLAGSVWTVARRELLAHVAAIGVTTVYNFFTIKYFALRADRHDGPRRPSPARSTGDP